MIGRSGRLRAPRHARPRTGKKQIGAIQLPAWLVTRCRVLVDCAHVGVIAEEVADARGDAIPFARGDGILLGSSFPPCHRHLLLLIDQGGGKWRAGIVAMNNERGTPLQVPQ